SQPSLRAGTRGAPARRKRGGHGVRSERVAVTAGRPHVVRGGVPQVVLPTRLRRCVDELRCLAAGRRVGAGEIGYGSVGYRDALRSFLETPVVATQEATGIGLVIEFASGIVRLHPTREELQ